MPASSARCVEPTGAGLLCAPFSPETRAEPARPSQHSAVLPASGEARSQDLQRKRRTDVCALTHAWEGW